MMIVSGVMDLSSPTSRYSLSCKQVKPLYMQSRSRLLENYIENVGMLEVQKNLRPTLSPCLLICNENWCNHNKILLITQSLFVTIAKCNWIAFNHINLKFVQKP